MEFRIKKYNEGYVVEIQKTKWYGKKYWTHFVSVSGIESMPWHHSTFDYAMTNLLDKIKWQTIRNSQ
jgi:hypothetical protein